MKKLIETTTGSLAASNLFTHCGSYAGEFQDKAYEIFQEIWAEEINAWDTQWMDIMYNQKGEVYAIWAEDALTCQNAWAYVIELDYEDCPAAFDGMKEKTDY